MSPISAEGKHVVIIGGGDTGADCLGTVHRQRALNVHQLEIMPEPPADRAEDNPWPTWPLILRTSSALEEGGERLFSVTTAEFVGDGDGHVRALRGSEVEVVYGDDGRPEFRPVEGSAFELPCELVLLAMGFLGTERHGVVADLGLEVNGRGNVAGRQFMGHQRGRRLRLRRHDPGPEPHRLGHRRGAVGRGCGGPVPDGHDGTAGADHPRPARPALNGASEPAGSARRRPGRERPPD